MRLVTTTIACNVKTTLMHLAIEASVVKEKKTNQELK